MTTRRAVYVRPDGGITVVVPAPASRLPGETEADWLARVYAREYEARCQRRHGESAEAHAARVAQEPAPDSCHHCDQSDLPASRRWRDAWRLVDGQVTVPLDAAREVRRGELLAAQARLIREAREDVLLLDPEEFPTEVARARLRLRAVKTMDLSGLDACTTLEALEAFDPLPAP